MFLPDTGQGLSIANITSDLDPGMGISAANLCPQIWFIIATGGLVFLILG
jgi:hypothetical protein